MSRTTEAIALLLVATLPACSGAPRIPGITPYKMEIQQGNFVSQEMASQLKAGMSKEQVRLTLGTPLLADAFHADRWDYVYWREAPNGKRETRKLAVYFTDDKLVRVDGDIVPMQKQLADPAPTPAVISPAPPSAQGAQPAPAGPEAPAARSAPPPPPAPPPPQTPPAQETR